MTPEQAKALKKGDRVRFLQHPAGYPAMQVEAVGRRGNNIRIWREDRNIPGHWVSDSVQSVNVEAVR